MTLAENASSVFDSVMYYTLSSTPELGLEIGLTEVKCEQLQTSFSCTFSLAGSSLLSAYFDIFGLSKKPNFLTLPTANVHIML